MNNRKILFIAHPYHQKTKSCDFLVDYLKEFYEIELLYYESQTLKNDFDCSKIDNDYFAIIFWQNAPSKKVLNKIKHDNILFFPMYDAVKDWKSKLGKWNNFKDIKIVSFSSTLHNKLQKWGFNSIYVQYFIEPKAFFPGASDEVFFWQRRTKDNINTLKKVFKNITPKIHIHCAVDPSESFIAASPQDETKYNVTYSKWFDSKDEMADVIKQKGIYIAPRRYEGIGMSFLEAMAMGKAVVANNKPTMNEYIQDGVTGYLCNFSNPKAIDFKNIEQVQKNTYEYAKAGYQSWLESRKSIVDFIEQKNQNHSYDFIVGLGNFCQVSYQLRKNNLQILSYPLDWLKNGTWQSTLDLFRTDFKDFFNKEDLKFVESEDRLNNRYDNVKTGFTFLHDFEITTFDSKFEKSKNKYNRRIKRLLSDLESSPETLLVYRNDSMTVCEIKEFHDYFKQRYSNNRIDLLWICSDRKATGITYENITQNIKKDIFDCDKYLGTETFHNGCEGHDELYTELFSTISLSDAKDASIAKFLYVGKKLNSFRKRIFRAKLSKRVAYLEIFGHTLYEKGVRND